MSERKKQSMLNGALILLISTAVVKIIGAVYKIPLTNLIGGTGRGYFSTAYNIYLPLYSISMAGLPTAVARLVSENMALGRYQNVRQIHKVSLKIFLLTGTIGTLLLLAVAYPYAVYVAETVEALPCILAVAPSIFFCCLMSSYRGLYEGQRNMTPTALSQTLEAVSKLILGLALAYGVMRAGLNQYAGTGKVFGQAAADQQQALSFIYPYTAAAAILGVTAGTVISWLFLMAYFGKEKYTLSKAEIAAAPPAESQRKIARTLIRIAIPIVLGSLIQNVTNLIDTAMIQKRIAHAISVDSNGAILAMYHQSFELAHILTDDIKTYLWGVYNTALDLKNLIPTITMSLGVSVLPALSAAWALRQKTEIRRLIESVTRICMLIALPAGIGLAVLAEPVLMLIYGNSNRDLALAAAGVLRSYGYTMGFFAISGPLINMLQAIGRTDVPVKSMLLGAAVKIGMNYILVGDPRINIQGAPWSTIACYLIIVVYNYAVLLKETGTRIDLWSVLIKPLGSAALCGGAAYAVYGLLTRVVSANVSTVISIFAACLVYLIALVLVRGISKTDILMLPKGEKIAKALEKYHLIG